ncbi:class II aldolase/adducin family protein [Anaeromyxobacter sp. K]|uniref:class II aldolase/adducin family protein n=1 Tax=Anaeromyxobacter sp. (strain K) TaxID=447217 RepID=UPI00015F938F|nr:class II aldolase/adducin family protein [Anaeromyxobacter sp. K]ACG75391.1 class II aldolase/adducin family protein [Anaeromyxobacter sp. K]
MARAPRPRAVPPRPAHRARSLPRERALVSAVVETCHRLAALDLIGAGEGNVSVRLGPDAFLVTASGVNKGLLRPGHVLRIDGGGAVTRGAGRPSTELRMHLAAYAARPDVEAIVHAHPITAVALTVAGVPPPNDLVPEAAVTLGEIALAPFATPGTGEVPASLAPYLARHDVLLLERHGALALGRTLVEALDRMETLERVARIALAARLAGRCTPLPADAVDRVLLAAGRPARKR